MGKQHFFRFFQRIKTTRCRVGKITLFIIAIMVIKLAVRVLEDYNTLLVKQVFRCLSFTSALGNGGGRFLALLGPLYRQPFSGLLIRHGLFDLLQIILGLPFAGKFLLSTPMRFCNFSSNR